MRNFFENQIYYNNEINSTWFTFMSVLERRKENYKGKINGIIQIRNAVIFHLYIKDGHNY